MADKIRVHVHVVATGEAELSDSVELAGVPRIGEQMTYKASDETRLSIETRDRLGAGVLIYDVVNVRWHQQDPNLVDVWLRPRPLR